MAAAGTKRTLDDASDAEIGEASQVPGNLNKRRSGHGRACKKRRQVKYERQQQANSRQDPIVISDDEAEIVEEDGGESAPPQYSENQVAEVVRAGIDERLLDILDAIEDAYKDARFLRKDPLNDLAEPTRPTLGGIVTQAAEEDHFNATMAYNVEMDRVKAQKEALMAKNAKKPLIDKLKETLSALQKESAGLRLENAHLKASHERELKSVKLFYESELCAAKQALGGANDEAKLKDADLKTKNELLNAKTDTAPVDVALKAKDAEIATKSGLLRANTVYFKAYGQQLKALNRQLTSKDDQMKAMHVELKANRTDPETS